MVQQHSSKSILNLCTCARKNVRNVYVTLSIPSIRCFDPRMKINASEKFIQTILYVSLVQSIA
jgi:hypothetical protein